MQRKTQFDHAWFQVTSHSIYTLRAAAVGQLPCYFALLKNRGPRRANKSA